MLTQVGVCVSSITTQFGLFTVGADPCKLSCPAGGVNIFDCAAFGTLPTKPKVPDPTTTILTWIGTGKLPTKVKFLTAGVITVPEVATGAEP
jgi:hypothetical protein